MTNENSYSIRGVSPVVATTILVVITVVLAGGVGILINSGILDEPSSTDYTGEAAVTENGVVYVDHVRGDTVNLTNVQIQVTVDTGGGTTTGTIAGLPLDDRRLQPENAHGALAFDESWGWVSEDMQDADFRSEDSLQFKIDNKILIQNANEIRVKVINIDSRRVIESYELTPRRYPQVENPYTRFTKTTVVDSNPLTPPDGDVNYPISSDVTIVTDGTLTINRSGLAGSSSDAFALVADGTSGQSEIRVYESGTQIVIEQDGGTVWSQSTSQVTIELDEKTVTDAGGLTSTVDFRMGNHVDDDIGPYTLRVENGDAAEGRINVTYHSENT